MTEQCGCGHSHDYHKECTCGCGCGCGCGCRSGSHHHHDEDCNCAEKFLELADEAWKEVLKEKIKAKIIAKKGEHMDKLAEIVAKANGEKWKNKITAKVQCHEFKEQLKDYFSAPCE